LFAELLLSDAVVVRRTREGAQIMRRALTTAITGLAMLTAAGGASLAAASTAAARSATLHLQFMSTSPTSNTDTVIATGLVTAGGTDVEGAHNVGVLRLPGGTIRARHSAGTGPQSFNPRTCLLTVSLHGTYKLLGGTGRYAGITGHGTYRLSILGVAARTSKGTCSQAKPAVAWEMIIGASGPATLP
jgi:hypothetical protein